MKNTAKKRGRPALGDAKMKQVAIRLPDQLLADLDAYADSRRDQPDRSAVIRELLVVGLERNKM